MKSFNFGATDQTCKLAGRNFCQIKREDGSPFLGKTLTPELVKKLDIEYMDSLACTNGDIGNGTGSIQTECESYQLVTYHYLDSACTESKREVSRKIVGRMQKILDWENYSNTGMYIDCQQAEIVNDGQGAGAGSNASSTGTTDTLQTDAMDLRSYLSVFILFQTLFFTFA